MPGRSTASSGGSIAPVAARARKQAAGQFVLHRQMAVTGSSGQLAFSSGTSAMGNSGTIVISGTSTSGRSGAILISEAVAQVAWR